jgi:hypothetical protein
MSFVCTLRRAIAADFFLNCWHLEFPSRERIEHIARYAYYHAQGRRLEMFQNFH